MVVGAVTQKALRVMDFILFNFCTNFGQDRQLYNESTFYGAALSEVLLHLKYAPLHVVKLMLPFSISNFISSDAVMNLTCLITIVYGFLTLSTVGKEECF